MNVQRQSQHDGYRHSIFKQICRVCLATNTKTYDMNEGDRMTHYEEITEFNIGDDDKFPRALCWECAHRLAACHRFRARARLAHCLLEGLLKADGYITETNIVKICRNENGLETRLRKNRAIYSYIGEDDTHSNNFEEDLQQDIKEEETEIEKPQTVYLTNDVMKVELVVKNLEMEEADQILEGDKGDESEGEDLNRNFSIFKDSDENVKEKIKIEPKDERYKKVSERSDNVKLKTRRGGKRKPRENKAREKGDESIISESELSLEEQIEEFEKRKQSDNYQLSPFKCELCFRGYIDEAAFKLHILKHSDKERAHECPICKLRYTSAGRVRSHVAMYHMFKYSCKKCSFVSMSRNMAKTHENYHKGTTFPCPHCEKVFVKNTSCFNHVRKKHASRCVCTACGRAFSGEKGLAHHVKLTHRFDDAAAPREEHRCQLCELRFASQKALETHLSQSHPGSLPPRERSKIRRGKSSKPKRLARPAPPIRCEQCDAQLADARAYHAHFRREHRDKNRTQYTTKPFRCMCEVCGRTFQHPSLLRDHMDKHAEGKRHRCARCQKTFQTSIGLQNHVKLHETTNKRFPCDICDRSYSKKDNLLRHRVNHTTPPQHQCATCDKRFLTRYSLKSHEEHVHLGVPWPKRVRGKRSRPADTAEKLDKEKESSEVSSLCEMPL